MATAHGHVSSGTPTPHRPLGDRQPSSGVEDGSTDGSWHDAASKPQRQAYPPSAASTSSGGNGSSLPPLRNRPGSFSSDLRVPSISRGTTPKPEGRNGAVDESDIPTSERRQAVLRGRLEKELKIKDGTENMLEALLTKNPKQTKEQRLRVESELSSSNRKIAQLQYELEEELQRAQSLKSFGLNSQSALFGTTQGRSPPGTAQSTGDGFEDDDMSETESPTFVLAETLQELEIEGVSPDYYIERANNLVDLFKRYPTLKYDLNWTVFGVRIQVMLLSDSREVVAAGYRLTRYAIADRNSIRIIRSFHTDELVILSLVKETKASMEREQALKFIRAFLEVKDGVREMSRAVVRTLVSIGEHREDRLRNICVMTLAEILVKDPGLLSSAGGMGILNEALCDGAFAASDCLAASFIHVLDSPRSRQYLRSGSELDGVFSTFTDTLSEPDRSMRLKSCAKAISTILKTWPGLLTLAQSKAKPLQSLMKSMEYPDPQSRNLILELLFDALRIKPPSWSSSFLAGRRLTTYGRVANLSADPDMKQPEAFSDPQDGVFDLTLHFSALVLAMLLEAGLIKVVPPPKHV